MPEVIKSCVEAGIHFWVLTGDMLETAINVGFSCGLLNKKTDRLVLDGISFTDVRDTLKDSYSLLKQNTSSKFALIISGTALIHLFKPDLIKTFLQIID